MADNTTQAGTALIATDELTTINGVAAPAGLQVQRTKNGYGPDGTYIDVDATHALPVEQHFEQGRVRFTLAISTTAPPTAATIQSASPIRGGVAGSGATSHAVTAGKTLRITGMSLVVRSTTAAVPWVLAELRSNPAGATTASSPMVAYLGAGGTAAASGNTGTAVLAVPDGWEFSGAETIGVTLQGNVNTNVVQVTLSGYEYTTPA